MIVVYQGKIKGKEGLALDPGGDRSGFLLEFFILGFADCESVSRHAFPKYMYYLDSTSPEEEMKGLRMKNGRFGAKKVILSLFSVIFEAEKTFLDLRERKIVP